MLVGVLLLGGRYIGFVACCYGYGLWCYICSLCDWYDWALIVLILLFYW